MKLKNKKTGKIGYLRSTNWNEIALIIMDKNGVQLGKYNSLAELNSEWEDYEDDDLSKIIEWIDKGLEDEILPISVNDFVEKLKAWKRLKDGGITFKNWTINQTGAIDCFATWEDNIPPSRKNPTLLEDLDLLFGGEE